MRVYLREDDGSGLASVQLRAPGRGKNCPLPYAANGMELVQFIQLLALGIKD